MNVIVQKFGGSSVATVEKIGVVARKVVEARRAGHAVVVVVSAMGDTTDDLIRLAREVNPDPPRRELDMLLTAGERISMAVLSSAIAALGEKAISLTGSQCGIMTNDAHTNARIVDVRPFRVQDELERGHIVIVAGFQGTSYRREVTTLGRGGSDTTAVALAAALRASACDIYSDVDGVFSADPRVVPAARKLEEISFEEMQEMARQGARVLNAQAVEFARRQGIAIYARATRGEGSGTVIHRIDGGADERLRELRSFGVRGVAGRRDVMLVSYEVPGTGEYRAEALMDALGDAETLSAVASPGTGRFDVVISLENVHDPDSLGRRVRGEFGDAVTVFGGLGSVAAIGLGVGDRAGALAMAHRTLTEARISVRYSFSTREAVACVVEGRAVEEASRALHFAFIERPAATAEPIIAGD